MLNAANEILDRDVCVTLVQAGTVLEPAVSDLTMYGSDVLRSVQVFIQNAATAKGWPMDLGHMIEEGSGGRSDPPEASARRGGVRAPGQAVPTRLLRMCS